MRKAKMVMIACLIAISGTAQAHGNIGHRHGKIKPSEEVDMFVVQGVVGGRDWKKQEEMGCFATALKFTFATGKMHKYTFDRRGNCFIFGQ